MRDLRLDYGVQLSPTARGHRAPGLESGRGTACGKAILLGEHFVVHGAPAIAVPVLGRTVTVTVERRSGPVPDAATAADQAVRAMLARLGLDPQDWVVSVHGTLPVSAGLGSSAALAVALVRALGERDSETVRARAHDLEHLAHGRPSGIDDAVVSYECPIRFERGVVTRLSGRVPAFWVATVTRTATTREAVARVAAWAEAHPPAFAQRVAEVRELVRAAETALHDDDARALGRVLDAAHAGLQAIGIVDPRQEALVQAARAGGALGAKVTGAGFGGAILALVPPGLDLGPTLRAAGAEDAFLASASEPLPPRGAA